MTVGIATSAAARGAGVIFDCPSWYCDLTDRHRLPHAAQLLTDHGDLGAADRYLALAEKPGRIVFADRFWEAMQALGESYSRLFYATTASAARAEQIMAAGRFTEAQLARGRSHEPLLTAVYESRLELVDELVQPSLLCHGRYDLVTPPQVIAYYDSHAPCGAVHTFEHAAHFPYLEQPAAYTAVLLLRRQPGSAPSGLRVTAAKHHRLGDAALARTSVSSCRCLRLRARRGLRGHRWLGRGRPVHELAGVLEHQLAMMIWIAVFPTLTALNLLLGDWLRDLASVARTFVLATVAVPIVI